MRKTFNGIAIFDLDFTLLQGDVEFMWSNFLFEKRLVEGSFLQGIQDYYADYDNGCLDIHEYEAFFLRPLTLLSSVDQQQLLAEYLEKVRKALRPKMLRQVQRHRAGGHGLLLVTASNNFLAEPIADLLGFDHLICTNIKRDGNVFTTELDGIPAFREGKILRLQHWLSETGNSLNESWGYSDSHNDIPLLSMLKHPVAVTPDPILEHHAIQQGWKIITL